MKYNFFEDVEGSSAPQSTAADAGHPALHIHRGATAHLQSFKTEFGGASYELFGTL